MRISVPNNYSLYFLCLAFGGLAFMAPYASNGTVVLLSVGVLGIIGNLTYGFQFCRKALRTPLGIALAMLLLWLFLSLSWSTVDVAETARSAVALVILCLIGLLFIAAIEKLDERQTRIVQTIAIISVVMMAGLFLLEWLSQGAIAKILKGNDGLRIDSVGRGLSILVCTVWPVACLMLRRFGKVFLVSVFLILVGATAYPYPNEAMFLSFLIGLFTFVACLISRRVAISFIFGVFAILVLAGPIVAKAVMEVPEIKNQAIKILGYRQHRINIWHYVATLIEERPIVGHGFEASRPFGAEENQFYLETREQLGHSRFRIRLPLHPHNIPLQIWLELGFIGILFYLGILFGIIRTIWTWRGPKVWAAALGASTASFLTVSSLSFGAWQNWWIATAWLTAGAIVLSRRAIKD